MEGNWIRYGGKLDKVWMEIGYGMNGNWIRYGWKLDKV